MDLFPAGEIVLDGIDFRNGAHLRFKADLFVPYGGRSVLCDEARDTEDAGREGRVGDIVEAAFGGVSVCIVVELGRVAQSVDSCFP